MKLKAAQKMADEAAEQRERILRAAESQEEALRKELEEALGKLAAQSDELAGVTAR